MAMIAEAAAETNMARIIVRMRADTAEERIRMAGVKKAAMEVIVDRKAVRATVEAARKDVTSTAEGVKVAVTNMVAVVREVVMSTALVDRIKATAEESRMAQAEEVVASDTNQTTTDQKAHTRKVSVMAKATVTQVAPHTAAEVHTAGHRTTSLALSTKLVSMLATAVTQASSAQLSACSQASTSRCRMRASMKKTL